MVFVGCFVFDLFFQSKIEQTAKLLNKGVVFFSSLDDFFSLKEFPEIVLIDLNNSVIDCVGFAKKLKANSFTSSIKLVGFLSHIQTDLMSQARDSGFDLVLPKSLFSQKLAEILKSSS